jgi:hypothetical protein
MKSASTNLNDVLVQLESWGMENYQKQYANKWAGDNQFGGSLGNLRGLAKKLQSDHDLALQRWATDNADALILATMFMAPAQLYAKKSERMLKPIMYRFTPNGTGRKLGDGLSRVQYFGTWEG